MMNTTKLKNITKCIGVSLLMVDAVSADHGTSLTNSDSIVERERKRRIQLINEAEQHLKDGRDAYAKGDFATSVEQYRAARNKIPRGSVTATRRAAIDAHLADASVALAERYRAVGKYNEARELLGDVVTADPANLGANTQLEYLDDPIRSNPALTYEHTQNVDRVRRLLYKGEGFYNLGQFDEAESEFNNVLKIDKYNTAARRWLERVAATKSRYYLSARDHTRAHLLAQVDAAWETSTLNRDVEYIINDPDAGKVMGFDTISNKLKSIIVPKVDMVDLTIEEAIDELRLRSIELDPEIDPTKKGINFIIKKPKSASQGNSALGLEVEGAAIEDPSNVKISELKLSNLPLVKVLEAICDLTSYRYRIDEFTVTLLPQGEDSDDDLLTRSWKVVPTFETELGGSGGGLSGGGTAASDDPFGAVDDTSSSSAASGIQALLEQTGISFGPGAKASLLKGTSTLIVTNTINNLDSVDQIVNDINSKIPKQIKITSKFVEINQDNTDEIGFDWQLGLTQFGGDGYTLTGGSQGNGRAVTDFTNGSGRTISSGLRSGDFALPGDGIDTLITDGAGATTSAAPGILSIGGIINGTTLEMVFRGLAQKRGIDIMTAPSVVARSGDTARIEVIREFIYPTDFDPPRIPQRVAAGAGSFPVTPTTPTAFETRNTGVSLEILPQTGDADDFVINLKFQPEVVEFEGFVNYGSPILGNVSTTNPLTGFTETEEVTITENRIELPIFSTRRVESAITIFDGHTVAVGGLIREDVQKVEDKIPILGDIPLVGRLFQSNSERTTKSNLVVFVTAQVIDATGRPVRKSIVADAELDKIIGEDDGLLPAVE